MSKKKKQKIDLTPYEDRAQLCPHFGSCGGCTHQKISYENQLQMKAEEVENLLKGVYPSFTFEGIIPSPSETGYRNKMEFTFGDECKDGPFALGLHQKGSYMNIVNIEECILVHPDMNLIRNAVRDYFAPLFQEGKVRFRNNRTGIGYLRHLLLRRAAGTGEILVALVTASQTNGEDAFVDGFVQCVRKLEEKSLLEGKIAGILHMTNDAVPDVVKSDCTRILYGTDTFCEKILGLQFQISPFSFFQTNTFGAERLYEKAREYASQAHGVLFDLYSGTGTIAQLMAPAAERVIGVEIVAEAVEAAKKNAAVNGISNVEFLAGDVLKVIDDLPVPDSLILDPPREGIHPKALGKILRYGVEQIVYVSCKPSSLARDLESFCLAGYELVKACCVDMFPQTAHVETCACLVKMSKSED